ncbi:MAG: addiction module protein [Gemmataceae bacterium]
MSTATPLDEIRTWPLERRLELVFQVWDDILDAGWQPTLDDDLKAELDRRVAAYQANPSDVRTWDQIEARLRGDP